MSKFIFLMLLVLSKLSIAHVDESVQCPTNFVLGPKGSVEGSAGWYETDIEYNSFTKMTLELVFQNIDPLKRIFTFTDLAEDKRFGIWIGKAGNLIIPAVDIISVPNEPVVYGEKFSYKISIDLSGTLLTNRIISFRPVTLPMKNTAPKYAKLLRYVIHCEQM